MDGRTAVVVGGGIGGLATAAALHRSGWRVHVLERAPEFTDIGAGLSLWPNAMRALEVLGLADAVRARAAVESGGGVRDRRGRWLSRADNDEIARRHGWPVLLVHRADLVRILAAATPAGALHPDCPLRTVRLDGDRPVVPCPGGPVRADLVVGADGVHSAVRRQWWPRAPLPRYVGCAAWRMITRPVPGSPGDGAVHIGRGERIGFTAMPGNRYYVFAAVSGPPGGRTDPAWFRARFADWPQPIPSLIDAVADEDMLRHDVYDLAAQPTYARDRVALVGDAAHAMDPALGQGAGQALEDAVTLTACLDRHADVAAALADYDRTRRPRTRAIVRRAGRLGAVAQWSWPAAALARDALARWLPAGVALRGLDTDPVLDAPARPPLRGALMPDWTYQPLRGIAAALLGERRSHRTALRLLATLGRRPAGARLVASAFGHRHPPAHLAGSVAGVAVTARLGVVVPPGLAIDAVRAMPPLGVGLIEVAPVLLSDVDTVRAAAASRRVPVLVRAAGPDTAAVTARLTGYVDAVRRVPEPALRYPTSADVLDAAAMLDDPSTVVIASPALLVRAGPGWFARVIEAATPGGPPVMLARALGGLGIDPRRWPAWWWALLLGAGMVVAGLTAMAITLGPVLLWYDRDYLGVDTGHLHAINQRLIPFLRHDRVTMAGTLVTIGVLYIGLALGGIRRGWPWARDVLLASGCVGFPTLFYFLGSGFVEPLQTAATALLLPMFLAAVRPHPTPRQWTPSGEDEPRRRHRALVGQLLMVLVGLGLFVGGAVISTVGLTAVFVPTDLRFLVTGADALHGANPRLVPFIAHDRAGFGGALLAAATAVTLLSMWGWRRGEAWVWWSLLLAAAAGFLPTVAVHWSIGYTDPLHLAPVYAGIGITATALGLARPYLCARPSLYARPAPARELSTLG